MSKPQTKPRHCSYKPCSVPLPPDYEGARCSACRAKAATQKQRKRDEIRDKNKENRPPEGSLQSLHCPDTVSSKLAPLCPVPTNVEPNRVSHLDNEKSTQESQKRPKVSHQSSITVSGHCKQMADLCCVLRDHVCAHTPSESDSSISFKPSFGQYLTTLNFLSFLVFFFLKFLAFLSNFFLMPCKVSKEKELICGQSFVIYSY